MRITNLTNKTYEYDDGDELEIAVLRNTDDYDLQLMIQLLFYLM